VTAAQCGRVCVAEVEEIVEPGMLGPDEIHLPGVYRPPHHPRRALRQAHRAAHDRAQRQVA
jgi:hypothetical protein